MSKIRDFIRKKIYKNTYSSEAYVTYLKKNGVSVGQNTYFFDPKSIYVDTNRGYYIKIGSNCKITARVMILAHDYSWTTIIESHKTICPIGGKCVEIGDNVFVGVGSIIVGNVKIGNNVIIGSGTVVTKDIPDNCVAVGNPMKIIKDLDSYYKKVNSMLLDNLILDTEIFIKKNKRFPKLEELDRYIALFVDKNDETFNIYLKHNSLEGVDKKILHDAFMNTPKLFEDYEKYVEYYNNRK